MPGPQLLTSVSFAITLQLQFERFKQFAFERFNNSRLRRISNSRLRGSSNFGWYNQHYRAGEVVLREKPAGLNLLTVPVTQLVNTILDAEHYILRQLNK